MASEFGYGVYDATNNKIIRLNDDSVAGDKTKVGAELFFTSTPPTTVVMAATAQARIFEQTTVVMSSNQILWASIRDSIDRNFINALQNQVSTITVNQATSLHNLRNVLSANDLLVVRRSGNALVVLARAHTAEQLAAITAAEVALGNTVIPAANVLSAAEAAAAADLAAARTATAATEVVPAVVQAGLSSRLASFAPRTAAALARFAPIAGSICRGAARGSNILVGGLFYIEFVSSAPNNINYRQGRLQLINTPTDTDSERLGIGSTIYFTPLNINPVVAAQVTIGNRFAGLRELLPYRIVDMQGNVPKLDITQGSNIPFAYDRTKLESQTSFIPGRPFDIFMSSPRVNPDNGVQARIDANGNGPLTTILNNYTRNAPIVSGSFLGRFNDGPIPSNPSQLPHMFFMNWKSNTARRVAGVGHYLVMDDQLGWCLGTKTTEERVRIDNLPGYFQIGAECGHHKYIYLGSAIPVTADGKCICVKGCRLLTNYMNPLGYNDFTEERFRYWSMSKLAQEDTYVPILHHLDPNIWKHYYLNPGTANDISTASGVMPGFAHPYGGILRLNTFGGYKLRVLHNSDNTLLKYGGTDAEFTGNANCTNSRAVMENLVLAPTTPNLGGFNAIEVKVAPPTGGMSRTRNDAFVAYSQQIAHTSTVGVIGDQEQGILVQQHNAQNPGDQAVLTNLVGQQGRNGFGMIGSC